MILLPAPVAQLHLSVTAIVVPLVNHVAATLVVPMVHVILESLEQPAVQAPAAQTQAFVVHLIKYVILLLEPVVPPVAPAAVVVPLVKHVVAAVVAPLVNHVVKASVVPPVKYVLGI